MLTCYLYCRRFVERELFDPDGLPEKHDLTYFPTVNDLQNHIHQAIKDIHSGILPVTEPTVSVCMNFLSSYDLCTCDILLRTDVTRD